MQEHYTRRMLSLPKIRKGPTMAQKLGLVPAPPEPLTVEKWEQIEEQAKKRDKDALCPICLEKFKTQEHVILSCSHIYHKQCLESFEKISKQKQCPICRKQDYEKKQYHYAKRLYELKSIIKIQSYYRGYRERIRFFERLIQMQYKPEVQRFRRRLLGYKLGRVSRKMQMNMVKQNKQSQMAVQELAENYQQKIEQMQTNIDMIRQLQSQNRENKVQPIVNWVKVREACLKREDKDCTICYQSMLKCNVYILSCSHIFHANCLNAFERYQLDQNHTCPLCRQSYQKQHCQLQK